MEQKFAPLKPKVVLGVVAHPDDLEFFTAGSMAKFADAGADVYYLILTDGSSGSEDRTLTTQQLIQIRQDEQRAAGKILGLKDVFFLAYPDGGLNVTQEVKRDIVRHIRMVKPDVVVTIDPSMLYAADYNFINHPDHRAAGQAALDATFPLARDHLSFPELLAEGLEPHKTNTVLLINMERHNFAVDISDTYNVKMKAIKAHTSQIPPSGVVGWVTDLARTHGSAYGFEYGEAFVRIDVD